MSKQLPERSNVEQLKKQAKDLLDGIRGGQPEALARMEIRTGDSAAIEAVALHDAQRAIAREYGFASWPKLKLHVETRTAAAEARLIEAVLSGEEAAIDHITRERPDIARRSVFVAAVRGDMEAVATAVESNPAAATTRGGPRGWEPLLYLCFGRKGGDDGTRARIAELLLRRGADANASWIHPDWPDSPLPALYGATGVNNFPQLARVLLAAGANPNDGESRYHAAQHHHVACLEVLREFGTDFSRADGEGGTTPLGFLLGWVDPTPAVRAGLRWLLQHGADPNVRCLPRTMNQTALHVAIAHGWDGEMVNRLLDHGADPNAARGDGRTAYALAVRSGRADLAALLRARGAAESAAPRDVFLGACMRADAPAAQAMCDADPDLMATLTPDDRKVALLAAKRGWAEALTVFGRLGVDLAVEGDWGEHPLHWAAWHGHAPAVKALIEARVPLSTCDRRFSAPPTGWAAHGSEACPNAPSGRHAEVMELLIAAGAFVAPHTDGSREVMTVLRRHGLAATQRGK